MSGRWRTLCSFGKICDICKRKGCGGDVFVGQMIAKL